MKKKIILAVVSLLVLSFGLFVSFKAYERHKELKRKKEAWSRLEQILQSKVMSFNGTVGLVVEDLNTGWQISFNEDTLLPSASLVKVPLMLACFYAAEDGRIALDDRVYVKPSEIVPGSKELGNKSSGSTFTVEELLRPMITESDNTAANVLINLLGFNDLNSYFKRMGLRNTNLARKMLDFEKRKEGEENYTTARDMVYLLEKIYRENVLSKDISRKCLELLAQQKINDRIPKKLPKGTLVAHKTGLENYICHDAGIVYTDKGSFLICVLTKHNDLLAKHAKKFISDVTLLTYKYYQNIH